MKKSNLVVCMTALSLLLFACRTNRQVQQLASPSATARIQPVPNATQVPVQTLTPLDLSGVPEDMRIIIFDDDGSPDGTTALLYFIAHQDTWIGSASISYGEAHPQVYIQHIGRMLESFGITDVPLGAGQDAPLSGSNAFPEWLREASNNFWGHPIPFADKTYPVRPAADLMVEAIKAYPRPVTVFISGPCTNLAQALRQDPGIKNKIESVYIMGGAVYVPGNIYDFYPDPDNKVAEWNIFSDPLAAKEVFESGLPIYLVPLDATNLVTITQEDTSQWRQGGLASDFAADIYDALLVNSPRGNMAVWDLMTAAIASQPELCGFQPLSLDVVMEDGSSSGQTLVVNGGTPNIQVCLEPDVQAILQKLIEVFRSGS